MKQTLLTTALLITTVLAFAQAPQGINYQAVVRDAGGNELVNQAVSLRMTILENNTTTVYQETHSATTNGFGLVNLVIGQGTATLGAFNAIDWSTGNYFAQTEVDVTGGTNYALMGSQQLMSVPYALYAESAGGGSGNVNISVSPTGDTLYFGNGQWVLIGGLSTLNGILWGEDLVYTVGQGVTDIDGNEYETIVINGEEWMAENLCTSSFQNGDPLTLQTTNPGWGNSTSEAYCWYNNNQSYEADYCKLYNWYAATDPRELCPVGWRVPTASDWQQLVGYLDPTCNPCTNGASTAVNALKESGSLLWLIDNSESTNASGFSARAAGRRDGGGSFNTIGETVYFWTSTPSGSQSKGVYFFYDDFNLVDFDEDWGMSIRCIKD
jgi:uncharacterized protein (TIGR02145 family)